MNDRSLRTPLAPDELASLGWIASIAIRTVIPTAHRKKLLAAGYIRETVSGLVVTDLGLRLLAEQSEPGTKL
jgi:hypothetical protein